MHKSSKTSLTELQRRITRLTPMMELMKNHITAVNEIANIGLNIEKAAAMLETTRKATFSFPNEIQALLFISSKQRALMAQQISEIGKHLENYGITETVFKTQEDIQTISTSIDLNILNALLYQAFSRPDLQNIKINPDGSVKTDTDFFSKEEVEESIIQVNKNVDENNISEKLLKETSKGNTLQILALIIMILFAIPNLYSNLQFYQKAINTALKHAKSKTQLVRSIQHNPTHFYEGINLNSPTIVSTKFVITLELSIWAKPKTKSQKLGILFFGDAVIVLRKKKNWTLVEPLDENKRHLKGWTFTRYLKNIVPTNKQKQGKKS